MENMTWIALVAALLPLPVAYLMGRRLLRRVDEPTFAEEWWRYRVRMSQLAFVAAGAATALDLQWAAAWIAVAVFASWIGNFRTYKQLFGEEWSLGGFLLWRLRYTLGFFGGWLLFLAVPFIIAAFGPEWALPLFVLLLVWQIFYERLMLRALDARPIEDEELLTRFAPIIAKAKCPEPRVVSIGPRRGFFPNAFALPGQRRGAVMVTDTLLRNLEPDETMGVFAHEMAHLEHHSPRRTAQQRGLAIAWMVFIVGLSWAAARDSAHLARMVGYAWVSVLFLGALVRNRWRQKHEGESDLRAVELCGDPEALIRGLTKLHTLMRVPRRWDSAREARLTHPSLARRIQALRRRFRVETSEPTFTPLTVTSRKRSGDTFAFDRTIVRRLTDDRVVESIPYSDLTAMHVRPAMTGPLLVYRRGGESPSTFPLHLHDVAAVQALLDEIDIHLAPTPPDPTTAARKALPRVVAALAFVVSLVPGIALPAAIAFAVAFFFPASTTMAGAGVTAIAAAFAALLHAHAFIPRELLDVCTPVLSALGGIACLLAFRARGDRRWHRGTWVMLVALALAMAVTRDGQASVIALFGLAATLAFLPRFRWTALAPLVLALGGIYYLTVFADFPDPLKSHRLAQNVAPPRLLASLTLDRPVDFLRLSPDGSHFVTRVRSENQEAEGLRPSVFLLGTPHETPVPLGEDALLVDFVDNDHLAIRGEKGVHVTTLDGHETSVPLVPSLDESPPAIHVKSALRVRELRIPHDFAHVLYIATTDDATHIGLIDARTRVATPLVRVDAVLVQAAVTSDLRAIARTANGAVLLIDPRRGIVSRIAETEVSDPADVAIRDHSAAVVQWTTEGSQLLFYDTHTLE